MIRTPENYPARMKKRLYFMPKSLYNFLCKKIFSESEVDTNENTICNDRSIE